MHNIVTLAIVYSIQRTPLQLYVVNKALEKHSHVCSTMYVLVLLVARAYFVYYVVCKCPHFLIKVIMYILM